MASEFKLKGLSSLDLKNGQKQEVEVEGIEGGKVLLVKINDEVHAMNSNCTHYGAPLVKGVVTGDGRLTCPWHGACFNIASGDVEDAPALDPLHKFKVFEKSGGVFIQAQQDDVKAQRRALKISCKPKQQERVLVVGGGAGALGAVEELRGKGYQGHITMISRENTQPIDRTKLSKALITDASKVQWRTEDWYKEAGIDLVYSNVTKADLGSKTISTDDGKSYNYTKLILASGGSPRWLPLEGLKQGQLENVFVLRALPHTQAIMKAAGSEGGKKVVVVGSSFIGMEVGNALAGQKHDVTIIGMESEPMEKVMGSKVGAIFRALLEKNGVKFVMNASVEKAAPSKSNSKAVGSVHLKDGTVLEADLVVEGVGVAPSTQYLEDTDVKLEKDGSVSVDESFAVRGHKDVWAIGDIATYPYHGPGGNGKPVRIEHWDVAQNAGRSVAQSILSPGSKPKSFIPVFWSAVGAQMRYCGHTPEGFDDVILQGETKPDKPSWVAYFTKGDEVHAVASMMKDPYMTQSAELMRRGAMPKKSEIQKGVDIMEISVPSQIKI